MSVATESTIADVFTERSLVDHQLAAPMNVQTSYDGWKDVADAVHAHAHVHSVSKYMAFVFKKM